jgi:hypothetical protein
MASKNIGTLEIRVRIVIEEDDEKQPPFKLSFRTLVQRVDKPERQEVGFFDKDDIARIIDEMEEEYFEELLH